MTESRAASAGRRLERHNGFHSSANSGGTQAAGAGARPRHDTGLERGRTTRAKGGGGGGRRSVVGEGKGREGGRCGQRMKWGQCPTALASCEVFAPRQGLPWEKK